ncbi:hypothetical protein HBI56_150070 [Parastagonospora nodorum]|uniref:Uncharacterized protein n=1 Tax=Phaeosphaeria nodorum (strain SN15 / ATCC MYA-4574 / FGSC 10173) TaxID=321614 RepID=A0A7U2FIV7_PHANO|nr:hypothetical protein HBH56_184460 [Parastagonospora nodorum]QRD04060.1 hypothetical protein JI435_420590 [Parastagonospora nodorum SN15]KAH3926128.1 hypothetical protein HBH54_173610 [Parastagonospora nodorum]KAH3944842.1 hypothetical protein HBH53_151330 [Parastagonospora nodorum]KAH3962405.1 hypothetical protein HBH52_225080 [Parastagonospora nodorum]
MHVPRERFLPPIEQSEAEAVWIVTSWHHVTLFCHPAKARAPLTACHFPPS